MIDATVNSVHFPPRQLADFVIHYDDTAFYVNKFVLHYHSAYFRTYFDTLSSPTNSSSPTEPPTSKKSKHCNHPSIAHCIHLPQQTDLVEKKPATAKDFRLFPCHLYFASHYCYPPSLPKSDVDLAASSPPLSLHFPSIPSLDWSNTSPQLRFTNEDGKFTAENKSLLAIAYYLDCAAVMAQCEAVLMTMVEWGKKSKDSEWIVTKSWFWLQHAARYKLVRAKGAFIRVIAADKGLLENERYKQAKQQWDKALLMEMMEGALMSKKK